jgi:hypothetical protein
VKRAQQPERRLSPYSYAWITAWTREAAAQQGGPLAHPHKAVSAAVRLSQIARLDGVADRELECLLTEGKSYLGCPGSVTGSVGQRLLEDPVRGLVGSAGQRSRASVAGEVTASPVVAWCAIRVSSVHLTMLPVLILTLC